MKKSLLLFLFIFSIVTVSTFTRIAEAVQKGFIFGLSYDETTRENTLVKLDPKNGATTPVSAPFKFPSGDYIPGAVIDQSHHYYVLDRRSVELITIDTQTGHLSRINIPQPAPLINYWSLVFDSGFLFGLSYDETTRKNTLVKLDPKSGATTLVGVPFKLENYGGAVIDQSHHYYALGEAELIIIDTQTGDLSRIDIPQPAPFIEFGSLAFDSGFLLGLSYDYDGRTGESTLMRLDPQNGTIAPVTMPFSFFNVVNYALAVIVPVHRYYYVLGGKREGIELITINTRIGNLSRMDTQGPLSIKGGLVFDRETVLYPTMRSPKRIPQETNSQKLAPSGLRNPKSSKQKGSGEVFRTR